MAFSFDQNSQSLENIVFPVFLEDFLNQFFIHVPGAFASTRTISKYRKMAGCPHVVSTSREKAELLLTGLLYRPKNEMLLKIFHRKHEWQIAELFQQVAANCDISITHPVLGSELKSAIFTATGIMLKSDRTLKIYAANIAADTGQVVHFNPDAVYPPSIATAFARMALKKKMSKVAGGKKGAESRWATAAA